MDRRTLLTVALCFAIFALWQKYYIEPRDSKNTDSAINSRSFGKPNSQLPPATKTGAKPHSL